MNQNVFEVLQFVRWTLFLCTIHIVWRRFSAFNTQKHNLWAHYHAGVNWASNLYLLYAKMNIPLSILPTPWLEMQMKKGGAQPLQRFG